MTIAQLTYLVALDTHRNFNAAAKACYISQPTLSMQIQKLEEHLDVQLFDRSKQPVRPTVIGEEVVSMARELLAISNHIEQHVAESKAEISGDLRLGIIPTVAPYLLHRFIGKFSKAFPKVTLIVEEVPTNRLLKLLKQDRLDVAIAAIPLEETGIKEMPLYHEPFVAYIPSFHALAKEKFLLSKEIDPNDLLLLNSTHCFRNNVLNVCQNRHDSEQRNFHLESGNFDTIVRLCRQGYGLTLLPYLAALSLPASDKQNIKPFASPKPAREIGLIYSRTQHKKKLLNALSDMIKKVLPKELLQQADELQVSSPLAKN